MDFIIYALLLGIMFLFDMFATTQRSGGFYSLLSVIIGMYGFYQLEQDQKIDLTYFLSSSNSVIEQTTALQVCLFILVMFIIFSFIVTLRHRK